MAYNHDDKSINDFQDRNNNQNNADKKRSSKKYIYWHTSGNEPTRILWGIVGILLILLVLLTGSFCISYPSMWPIFASAVIAFVIFWVLRFVNFLRGRNHQKEEAKYNVEGEPKNILDDIERKQLAKVDQIIMGEGISLYLSNRLEKLYSKKELDGKNDL